MTTSLRLLAALVAASSLAFGQGQPQYSLQIADWDRTNGLGEFADFADNSFQYGLRFEGPEGVWFAIWQQVVVHDRTGQNGALVAQLQSSWPFLTPPAQGTLFDHPTWNDYLPSVVMSSTLAGNTEDVKKFCYPVVDSTPSTTETTLVHAQSPLWDNNPINPNFTLNHYFKDQLYEPANPTYGSYVFNTQSVIEAACAIQGGQAGLDFINDGEYQLALLYGVLRLEIQAVTLHSADPGHQATNDPTTTPGLTGYPGIIPWGSVSNRVFCYLTIGAPLTGGGPGGGGSYGFVTGRNYVNCQNFLPGTSVNLYQNHQLLYSGPARLVAPQSLRFDVPTGTPLSNGAVKLRMEHSDSATGYDPVTQDAPPWAIAAYTLQSIAF